DLSTIVSNLETLTTLVDNSDGTFTYTDEDGTATTFDVTQTGAGDPIATSTTGVAGDVYVDETTGDVWTFDGTTWIQQTGNETPLALTTDGNILGVTLSGVNDHIADITLLSTDVNNILTAGTDGGLYVDATETLIDKLVFSAEYAGAALEADGTDNLGFLTSDNAGSANSWMNYYHWENTQTDGGTNDYDVILRFTLPTDFTAWEANAIVIDHAGTSDANFTATVYTESSSSALAALGATTTGAITTWGTATIPNTGITLAAGQTGIIVLKMTATDVGTAGASSIRLGDITLNFTRLKN
ncbi:hypothetical protein, partial [uncultured Nonlabens sp.]|uniref:hypothetical protein n=1 Tax=uncultured Nonlabens sp. TaxID=859306 RepID=UPI0030D8BDF0